MGATMVGEELKILREHLWAIQVFGERKEIHFHHQPVDHHALLQCHSQQLPPTLGKVVFSRYVTTVGEYFDLMNFTAEINTGRRHSVPARVASCSIEARQEKRHPGPHAQRPGS